MGLRSLLLPAVLVGAGVLIATFLVIMLSELGSGELLALVVVAVTCLVLGTVVHLHEARRAAELESLEDARYANLNPPYPRRPSDGPGRGAITVTEGPGEPLRGGKGPRVDWDRLEPGKVHVTREEHVGPDGTRTTRVTRAYRSHEVRGGTWEGDGHPPVPEGYSIEDMQAWLDEVSADMVTGDGSRR